MLEVTLSLSWRDWRWLPKLQWDCSGEYGAPRFVSFNWLFLGSMAVLWR